MSLKHKVPQGYSPADLPIHAESGREWDPKTRGSLTPFGMTKELKLENTKLTTTRL